MLALASPTLSDLKRTHLSGDLTRQKTFCIVREHKLVVDHGPEGQAACAVILREKIGDVFSRLLTHALQL